MINILGLSVGIACSLLIAIYVINEASYDRFNVKKDRIYRLVLNGKIGGQEILGAYTCAPIGPTMVREFPEVEDCLRLSGRGPTVVEYNDLSFTDDHILESDSAFFNFFSIPLLKGDPKNVLNAPRRAVLSESTAKKIFGNENPVDKAIKIGDDTARYIVSGVMADVPGNCHFEASILTSFMTNPGSKNPVWLSNSYSTYLLLKPNTSSETVDAKIPVMLEKYVGPEIQRFMGISIDDFMAQGNQYGYFLQNLKDIHLDPSIQQEFSPASDPKYLWIFGSISLLIIIIAAINFMNLATAQATRRSREVGVKKVAGSTRGMLISQFIAESCILAFISLIIALILIWVALPYFNNLLGANLNLRLTDNWFKIPVLLLFTLVVGIFAGSYPAFFLSSFNPVEVLKGSAKGSMRNGNIRRILVVFQFAISILLITGTLVMYRQIFFMLNKDVGFDKEQLVVINMAHSLHNRVEAFKESVLEIPGVINIASSTAVPGRNNNLNGYGIEGRKDESFLLQTNWVDPDYLDTYRMELVSGRKFDRSFTSDRDACIINETAAKNFNITDISNTRFLLPLDSGKYQYLQVIGIVKNFNFESLRNPIQPYIFVYKTERFNWGYVTVKLSAQNYQQTISEIEKRWKQFTSNNPLQYYFVDQDFEQMYLQEKQNAQLAVIFSVLAIFIAALGLFGLTSFTVEQRTKEIGVRKAMGSSVSGIYYVISREILVLVTISALIAWPLIYFIAKKWLENFYFRIDPGAFSFLAGLGIALMVATITISYRILKAAAVNPAQSLKYE
ncbi:MAG: FtsX-like permease family protein [Bacteroidales bacterium]|jgi:putative ABC transport system permease protein|nr:FtsX-like permease family protein [Bacteroidales bacterium]HOW09105.1 ABC transporter permease [Bacteroidales bacterium]